VSPAWTLIALVTLSASPDGGIRPAAGGLSKAAITRIVRAGSDDVRACYEKNVLAMDPSAEGTYEVQFTIGPRGTVVDTQQVRNDFKQPELPACIGGVIRSWRFPAPGRGGEVEVSFPWVFTAPDAGEPPAPPAEQAR
jgi:hypothetical protein